MVRAEMPFIRGKFELQTTSRTFNSQLNNSLKSKMFLQQFTRSFRAQLLKQITHTAPITAHTVRCLSPHLLSTVFPQPSVRRHLSTMSLFPPQFQIVSDLHLETPLSSPSYTHFSHAKNFPLHASNLFLLGDIGCIRDSALLNWLKALLSRTPNLKIFYVCGNHEFYGLTMAQGRERLRAWEKELRAEFGHRFWFLDGARGGGRVDVSDTLTVLGCTLWSRISEAARPECERLLMDFNQYAGILGRTAREHNREHGEDLEWLNGQVSAIEREEPGREVVVLTHHCPTKDPRACDPRHVDSSIREGFSSFLAHEPCWGSERVRVWAFGHTHYSCCYADRRLAEGDNGERGERDLLVVSCQKGYAGARGQGAWSVDKCVLERQPEGWKVLCDDQERSAEGGKEGNKEKEQGREVGKEGMAQVKEEKKSVFESMGGKIGKKLGLK